MTANEISDKISTFERELADIAVRIRNAEEIIRQLQCLKDSCVDYQEEFENHKHRRIQRMEELMNVWGQDKFIGEYADAMNELLTGNEYLCAYNQGDTAIFDIECEIRKQRLIVSECSGEQNRLSQNIIRWKRELEM